MHKRPDWAVQKSRTINGPKAQEKELTALAFRDDEIKSRLLQGSIVKNPPCNAGDVGSNPGRGMRIPHALEQLGLCTTTADPPSAAAESGHRN